MGSVTGYLQAPLSWAHGPEWNHSIVQRCLIAGRAVWFYAGKLVWPENLTFIYHRWRISWQEWQLYLFPIGVLAVVGILG